MVTGSDLRDLALEVSNDGSSWTLCEAYTGPATSRITFTNDCTAARFRLFNEDFNVKRQVAEAEFFAPASLSLGKAATQSSTYSYDGPVAAASKAVDGNTDGNFLDGAGSVSATTAVEMEPWWQVDLGAVVPVRGVNIFNRTDCCSWRLSHFDVMLSDDGQTWQSFNYPGEASRETTIRIPNRTARYVKIKIRDRQEYLQLAEVRVF